MTVKELQENLSKLPDDKEVELFIESILDNRGDYINGRSKVEHIGYGMNGCIELSGYDLYS